ncbi:MAG: DUF3592 domain-containing protein [Gemmatimonadaceae bacterium]|nr:DUF3592 domain-containing protein [Gemmatimonadaceae bacterium]
MTIWTTISVLMPVLIVGGWATILVRRGLQMKRLAEDGVAATARITGKLKQGGTGVNGGTTYRLRYEYAGPDGVTHTYRSVVGFDEWSAVEEGDPFPIYYSASKPSVSGPARLVEASRAAIARRGR